MKIKWGYYMQAFPYTCDKCGNTCYELRNLCEMCGRENTLRKTKKKDYKAEMKKRKEYNK